MSSQRSHGNYSFTDSEETMAQRDKILPDIISRLSVEEDPNLLVKDIKISLDFLNTYEEVHSLYDSILRDVMSAIRGNLQKVYDENIAISETTDDELVVTVLKENLKIAISLFESSKTIIEHIYQFKSIPFKDVPELPQNITDLLYITFGHCKNCQNIYQDQVKEDLLALFGFAQEVHSLFLKILPHNFEITDAAAETCILNEVLQAVCNISDILSEISIKLMIDNWKGFLSITQKFLNALRTTFNLQYPLRCLTAEIDKNFNNLFNENESKKDAVGVIKVTGFLAKVVLKIVDTFWDMINEFHADILNFCMSIFGFSVDLLKVLGGEIESAVNCYVIKCVQPFLLRLTLEDNFVSNISDCNPEYRENYSTLYLLNNILKTVIGNNQQFNNSHLIRIAELIFTCLNRNFKELATTFSAFDDLIIHTTAAIFSHNTQIEHILLENILQTNIWCALFAIEVYTLLLRNAAPSALENLISHLTCLDFGLFTYRTEQVFLRIFIQRIFRNLPVNSRACFVDSRIERGSGRELMWLRSEDVPANEVEVFDRYIRGAIERIPHIRNGTIEMNDFLHTMNGLCLIGDRNVKMKREEIGALWHFTINENITENHIFHYFAVRLLRITECCFNELSESQILMILNQLTRLSTNKGYKVHVCHFLRVFSQLRDPFSEQQKINSLLTNICKNLLSDGDRDRVIGENVAALVGKLRSNCNYELLINVKNAQGDTGNNSKTIITTSDRDKYVGTMEFSSFLHNCVQWNRYDVQANCPKRMKMDKLENNVEVGGGTKGEEEAHTDDDVAEILIRIKGEMKCLTKALKTHTLNRKNINDVNFIINNLQSYL